MTRFIGLTGSIGMGKSTAVQQLRRMGIAVHDADYIVHQALAPGGAAFAAVAAAFPEAVREGKIDRRILGAQVFSNPQQLNRLEHILHPIVRRAEQRFRRAMIRQRRKLAVLDIPLLFETNAQKRMDHVVVVTAPRFLQHQRVLRRPGMDPQRLGAILRRQMPDYRKRQRADTIIQTGLGRAFSWRQWQALIRKFG